MVPYAVMNVFYYKYTLLTILYVWPEEERSLAIREYEFLIIIKRSA